jgi:hypothetical protein
VKAHTLVPSSSSVCDSTQFGRLLRLMSCCVAFSTHAVILLQHRTCGSSESKTAVTKLCRRRSVLQRRRRPVECGAVTPPHGRHACPGRSSFARMHAHLLRGFYLSQLNLRMLARAQRMESESGSPAYYGLDLQFSLCVICVCSLLISVAECFPWTSQTCVRVY